MKKIKLFVALTLSLMMNFAVAQNLKVSGIVSDDAGVPIIGAIVSVDGTAAAVQTDLDGYYTLSNVPSNAVLNATYVGMKAMKQNVDGKTTINFELKRDIHDIDEIVIVGYGAQKRTSLTSSISTVDADELMQVPVSNTTLALQGRAPGLTIINNGGSPGNESFDIFIRGIGTTGDTSPLILVDGIEGNLADLSPSDIENISVLKDAASAAIYGSRAAHGVILVTTKRGVEGKPVVSYTGNVGIQMRAVVPEAVSAGEYYSMVNESAINEGYDALYSPEFIKSAEQGLETYVNYPDELYTPTIMQDHALAITGGNEKGKYRVSLGMVDQPAIVANNSYQRYNLRVNTDIKLGEYFTTSLDAQVIHSDRTEASDGQYSSVYSNVWGQNPSSPVMWDNGTYALDDTKCNPIAFTDSDLVGYNSNTYDSYLANLSLGYDSKFGLKANASVIAEGGFSRNKTLYKEVSFYDEFGNFVKMENEDSQVGDSRASSYDLTLRGIITYDKTFGKSTFSALVGAEQRAARSSSVTAQRKGLISTSVPQVSLGDADRQYAYGSESMYGMSSYFARLRYEYDNKYMIEANFRADGSSNFAPGNKWGYFPAFSGAWRISQESFMEDVTWLSDLKLRASWGQLGNERVGAFQYVSTLSTSSWMFNDKKTSTVWQAAMANPDMTWETTETFDVGLEFSFLNNSLYGELDYYDKYTRDILMDLPIPSYNGLTAPTINAGVIRNSGVEVTLGYRKIQGEFTFDVSGNFSYNKNEWVDRNGDDININGSTINQLGSPLNAYYTYMTDGLLANEAELEEYKSQYSEIPGGFTDVYPGDVRYVDLNGDGKVTTDDRYLVHPNIPTMYFSLNLNANYKGFDFSAFFQGTAGGNVYLSGLYTEGPSFQNFTSVFFRDRWTPENENGDAAVARLKLATQNGGGDFYIRSNDYIRLKNAQIGYTFTDSVIKSKAIKSLRVYISGTNLFTITAADLPQGYDPEGTTGAYPLTSVISLGANIQF